MNHLSAGSFKSKNSSTSTLRPRSTRLISYADDEVDGNPLATSSALLTSKPPFPFPSRGTSPLPSVGCERTNTSNGRRDGKYGHIRASAEQTTSHVSAGLWDPWSSLQGIASNLLGSDTQSSLSKVNGVPSLPVRRRTGHATGGIQQNSLWGPRTHDLPDLAAGSTEERQALVQAKKREALLSAQSHERPDSLGRYKRRDSGTKFDTRGLMEQESDSLVYIHHIRPGDTLAGVMIKYCCQPDVFRKVNRFWPNDNIQTRQHVLLPVDACAIRGKKVDNTQVAVSLFEADTGPSTSTNPASSSPVLYPLSHTPSNDTATSYSHDSWVLFPHFPHPIEILRVPHRTLGYFPPARRKPSHLSAYADNSITSTPKTSFDTLRHPPTHAASISLNASPVRRPRLNNTSSSSHHRSSSTTASTIPEFTNHLYGPGGVGPLHGLRTETAHPGPAPDPLNQKFAHYFPDLVIAAPPPPIEDFPRLSLRPTPSRGTPRASTDSIRSTNSSILGDMGGTIEGWARKLATGNHPRRPRTKGEGKMGDLIELDLQGDLDHSQFDVGADDGAADDAEPVFIGGTSATQEALLNERFPARGRLRTAMGKDKGD